ncbi:MAG: hypothetical protein E6767_08100 [Dysgonomonas sp.]|nr:hypothetical protein [Dysgonomonas sp.]
MRKEGLIPLFENVPWDNITHAYGRASDFPEQVEQFLSGDEEAFKKIKNNIERSGPQLLLCCVYY